MESIEGKSTEAVQFSAPQSISEHRPDPVTSSPMEQGITESASTCSAEVTSHQPSGTETSCSLNSDTGGPPPSREVLNQRAQHIIDEINEKRKRDTALLDDFRKALLDQVTHSCNALEERMYSVYETSGKTIQSKLQDLFATLDRVASIEEELDRFKQALGVLYTDIQHSAITAT